MEEQAKCELCGGTGWKPMDGQPNGQRRPPRVVRCDCRAGQFGEKLLAKARIPKRYEHCSLESFHTEWRGGEPDRNLADAKMFAGRFADEYPINTSGLMFIGNSGVGKTHLAIGILKHLIEHKGAQCMFVDYRELLKEIQESYNQTVQSTEMRILEPVFKAEVLVLDELGAVRPSDWVWDTVSLLLNSRYNGKKTTIITTNYPDGPAARLTNNQLDNTRRELTLGDRIGDRMWSRLHEMCRIVRVEGPDYRLNVKSHENRSAPPTSNSWREMKNRS